MYRRTIHATHPDMMAGASNEQLRERYLVGELFQPVGVVTETPRELAFSATA